ncbi:MAG TPA: hypothetical protein P5228_10280 [Bacteroidales bacterium]|nr:hypothetical protein [Bacteroidales bacterium]HRZ49861.1 hypothetical protein [Bacteroidales bacterium]
MINELSTRQKALQINLDPVNYGSFAEIGGGQEVSRIFFTAGGASGTIAKTISAYDMAFSDHIYGKSGRYVSRERLQKMLKTEYTQLVELLSSKREPETRFFSFANTVTTINYQKTNTGNGWLGIRFQLVPGDAPNQVIMHVRLLENDALLQQQTLGILGTNLIFAAFYYHDKPNTFLRSLLDDLGPDRVEITMVEMTGPQLSYVDNRLLSLQLVKNHMTSAVMFDRYGVVQQPADLLHRKNLMILRGSFRPVTYVEFDMLKTGYSMLKEETECDKSNLLVLCEMTLDNLLATGDLDERDFLARVDILNGMGQNVLVSTFREFYRLTDYLGRFQLSKIRIVIGIDNFANILEEKYYADLPGGLLEAFGKLFRKNTRLYIYPTLHPGNQTLITLQEIRVPESLQELYKFLYTNQYIRDIPNVKKDRLYIRSRDVVQKISAGDPKWLECVPVYISEAIIRKRLFGYVEVKKEDTGKEHLCH